MQQESTDLFSDCLTGDEDPVEIVAIERWCEFAMMPNAHWRWENRVAEKVKNEFRAEAKASLEGKSE